MISPDPALDEELQELVRALYERRDQGVIVPGVPVSAENWAPAENQCHDNVAVWVRSVAGTTHVYGFLHFPLLGRFNAHSVVEQEADGVLYDITPTKASMRYPFIRHQGPTELFAKAGAIGVLHYNLLR